jgi:hypothetical protein
MKINVIVTGATGMVGEGVLHTCLLHPDVESILVVGRRPCGVVNNKVKEVLVKDFFNLSLAEPELKGYDACFFCLGMSSVGMKAEDYKKQTYDLTINFARAVKRQNEDATFCYVSGAGTDGKQKWAKVKKAVENELMFLFKKAYMFRPGLMKPTEGAKNVLKAYKYFGWMYPVLRVAAPKFVCTLEEVGLAMINVNIHDYEKKVLEVPDIVQAAKL